MNCDDFFRIILNIDGIISVDYAKGLDLTHFKQFLFLWKKHMESKWGKVEKGITRKMVHQFTYAWHREKEKETLIVDIFKFLKLDP